MILCNVCMTEQKAECAALATYLDPEKEMDEKKRRRSTPMPKVFIEQ